MEKHILLTGGTGFFGKALLRHFLSSKLSNEFNICVLSRDPVRFQESYPCFSTSPQITYICGDVEKPWTLPWDQKFTHVLHAAADSTIGPTLPPIKRYHQIVTGTTNLLELAVATGASRFLLTSSGAIYGPQPPGLRCISEDWSSLNSLPLPENSYGQAKRSAEYLCTLYRDAYGLETIITRCFAFVGVDLPLDVHFAIGNFIRDALYGEEIKVLGNGTPQRTYMDQRDLAHWLWTLLLEGSDGESYNVGSDEVISIGELAYLVRDLLAPKKPVRILGTSVDSQGRNHYVPCVKKAELMHGLKANISLVSAISSFKNLPIPG